MTARPVYPALFSRPVFWFMQAMESLSVSGGVPSDLS
jgi:hypothetical protein